MSRRSSLKYVVVLTVLSLIAVMPESTMASIPKPAVPQFTLKLVDNSYAAPTTYSIDPYTGENVTHLSHHVDNKTIELKIENQPFVPYNESGWLVSFHYLVQVKGHYAENWVPLYIMGEGPTPSNSDHTVIAYKLTLSETRQDQTYTLGSYDTNISTNSITGLPSNAQIDFRVEATIGYVHRGYNPNATDQLQMWPWIFTGEESGWSNTQTITIDSNPSTSTPDTGSEKSTAPDQPGNNATVIDLYGIAAAVLVVLGVVGLMALGAVVLRRRTTKQPISTLKV
jgi:hypothetical protein